MKTTRAKTTRAIRRLLIYLSAGVIAFTITPPPAVAGDLMEIRVVDKETRRGIPMVELITVDEVVYITDSAGRLALDEPELNGALVFFKLTSPGYHMAKDGFGIEGVRLMIDRNKGSVLSWTATCLAPLQAGSASE
jgi:hypothetical protein